MAFSIRDLSVLAYAQGFTLWHYKAGAEPLGDVGRNGYFDDASDMLAAGGHDDGLLRPRRADAVRRRMRR